MLTLKTRRHWFKSVLMKFLNCSTTNKKRNVKMKNCEERQCRSVALFVTSIRYKMTSIDFRIDMSVFNDDLYWLEHVVLRSIYCDDIVNKVPNRARYNKNRTKTRLIYSVPVISMTEVIIKSCHPYIFQHKSNSSVVTMATLVSGTC